MTIWLLSRCWQLWRDLNKILFLSKSWWDLGEMLAISVRSLYLSKSRQDFTKIQKESNFTVRSRQFWWDLANLSEIELDEIWETHKHHGKISAISARWMNSCHDLAEIQKLTNIMARSPQSWWDLGSLSKISAISAISAISMRWRIIHHNLFEIQKLQTSWKSRQDLSKN